MDDYYQLSRKNAFLLALCHSLEMSFAAGKSGYSLKNSILVYREDSSKNTFWLEVNQDMVIVVENDYDILIAEPAAQHCICGSLRARLDDRDAEVDAEVLEAEVHRAGHGR